MKTIDVDLQELFNYKSQLARELTEFIFKLLEQHNVSDDKLILKVYDSTVNFGDAFTLQIEGFKQYIPKINYILKFKNSDEVFTETRPIKNLSNNHYEWFENLKEESFKIALNDSMWEGLYELKNLVVGNDDLKIRDLGYYLYFYDVMSRVI